MSKTLFWVQDRWHCNCEKKIASNLVKFNVKIEKLSFAITLLSRTQKKVSDKTYPFCNVESESAIKMGAPI